MAEFFSPFLRGEGEEDETGPWLKVAEYISGQCSKIVFSFSTNIILSV